jgi:hypothetical protein
MSGGMTFRGAVCFASADERDAAVAAVASAEDSLLSMGHGLVVRHLAVLVDRTVTAPSRMYSATHMALLRVCLNAVAASIECTFEGDEPEDVVARPRAAAGDLPKRSASRDFASTGGRHGIAEVLVLYALNDDSEEVSESSRSFVAGAVDGQRFHAYPAPDGLELPAVRLGVKLNELLADDTLAPGERAVFADALAWMHRAAAPLYVARLDPVSLAGLGVSR